MLVQDRNNITQYLAFHNTSKNKAQIITNIRTSTYSQRQKLYEINNISLNRSPNLPEKSRNDYDTIFDDKNLYAIPEQYIDIIEKIDPSMAKYVDNFKRKKEYNTSTNMQYWLRSANSKMYDHKGAFDKFGFIDWRQHNKFNINDIVFIYSSSNDKRIRYKTIVEKIDIPFDEINDDKEFWNNIEEYEKSKEGKYVRLKLLKEVNDSALEYENLKRLNYISNAPQGSVKITDKNFIDFLNNHFEGITMNIEKVQENCINIPLNQILYGPPGTGKTYNTIVKAMEIINPSIIKYNEKGNVINYAEIKNEFDNAKNNNQIEFVTFHQSYSYEEFVEGIKPDLDAESWNEPVDKLTYKGSNGIFKIAANRALFDRLDIQTGQQDAILDFKNLKEKFIEEYSVGSTFKTGTKNAEFRIDKYTKNSARITPTNGKYTYSITFKYLEEAYNNKMSSQGEIATINGVASGLSCYYYAIYEKLLKMKKSDSGNQAKLNITEMSDEDKLQLVRDYYDGKIELNNKDVNKPHVLIIDEINRGNISKIFGELITLIEEDKRENISVQLPYSHETFTVPNNLYIIGTMNTSDRSIASIDIALRRRFKFKEMMPKSSLVADFGIEFSKIFDGLNNKIKLLLDRDHQIGHSYFINTKYNKENGNNNISALKEIWFSEILPLLNEYFYCDWEKLNLIIPKFLVKLDVPPTLKNECEDSMYEFIQPEKMSEEEFKKALTQEEF
ncbi:MAG: AAA family ATPase [bacterium]|nr:AAA family ATPase [bacterium]